MSKYFETAIHRSTFSICRSSSHHHYTTGTMEHCLGVYDEMMKNNKDGRFCERDIILVSLLHDVGKGRSREFSFEKGVHHPTRSMKIVRRYLKNVPSEVRGSYITSRMRISRGECSRKRLPDAALPGRSS